MESNVSGLLRKAKKLDPSSNREEFVSLLETAIQIDPYASEPHLFLGLFYFKEQEWDKACQYLSEGLNLDCVASNKMELAEQAYVALGKTYRKLGNKEKSLLCFRALIGLYPTSIISIKLADQLYGKMNINPEWLKYYSLGCEAFINGKTDEAEQLLEKSAELNDIFPWTQYQMGLIYENKGDIELASFTFLQAIEEERHYLFCAALANSCYRLERKDEERKCIAEALALNEHYSVSLISLIHDAVEAGDLERADFLSEIIKTQIPNSIYAKQLENSKNGQLKFTDSGSLASPATLESTDTDSDSLKNSKISLSDSELLSYPDSPSDFTEPVTNPPSVVPETQAIEFGSEKSEIQLEKRAEEEKRITAPLNHLVKKEISISSDSGRLKKAIKTNYDSGKLKKEILSTLDSGKLKRENVIPLSETHAASDSARLRKEEDKPKESETISADTTTAVLSMDSSRLRKEMLLSIDTGKTSKSSSDKDADSDSGRLRKELSNKPQLIRPSQDTQKSFTYEQPRSSLESIMSKVDSIMQSSESTDKSGTLVSKEDLKEVIKNEIDSLRKEQELFLEKLTNKFEMALEKLSTTLENAFDSRFPVRSDSVASASIKSSNQENLALKQISEKESLTNDTAAKQENLSEADRFAKQLYEEQIKENPVIAGDIQAQPTVCASLEGMDYPPCENKEKEKTSERDGEKEFTESDENQDIVLDSGKLPTLPQHMTSGKKKNKRKRR